MAIFFSTTRRERTEALVLLDTYPTMAVDGKHRSLRDIADGEVGMDDVRRYAAELGLREDEIPDEAQLARGRRIFKHVLEDWGEGKALKTFVPHQGDEAQLGLLERLCASPAMAQATLTSALRLDVTGLLESVDVPTLLIHATGDLAVPVQGSRIMARRIPGARLLEVEGEDHAPWFSSPDESAGAIEQLLTGTRHRPRPQRVLATVLFTDIIGSTNRAAELGDARWREVLERHDELTRRHVGEFGGTSVKSTGDGQLATFDGPAAAVRCTETVRDALAQEGIPIRAGLHTGEIERIGEDVGGGPPGGASLRRGGSRRDSRLADDPRLGRRLGTCLRAARQLPAEGSPRQVGAAGCGGRGVECRQSRA